MISNTSISVTKETQQKLASLGTKGQTYDEIIKILISKWNESQ